MKIGIVGLGSIGSRHYANANKLGHEVKGYDPAKRHGGDVDKESQLYDWAEAVIVATPSPCHEGPLRAAIERRKHVLVEKPISLAVGALPALLALARERDLVVMMGNNLRFHTSVIQTKLWLEEGHIGKPIWASFVCAYETEKPSQMTDGAIMNTGAHEVDLATYLLGPGRAVMASAVWHPNSTDYLADFLVAHESGVRSCFHVDHVSPIRVRQFFISGSTGHIWCDLDARLVGIDSSGKMALEPCPGSYDFDYAMEIAAFTNRISGGTTPGATGEEGVSTLKLPLDIKTRAAFP